MAGGPFPYDRVAGTYARYRQVSPRVLSELHRGASLQNTSRILEVGCGTGNYVAGLSEFACIWGRKG